MYKAKVGETVVAEAPADSIIQIEGNIYFPKDSLKSEYFSDSETDYECPWKGHADYYNLNVDGREIPDAAWHYDNPKDCSIDRVGQDFAKFTAFDKNLVEVFEQE